jgi:hypothetical protein
VVACHTDTVVAVQDEVRISDLVEAHRRQLVASVEGSVYALPPRLRARPRGHEAPIELPTSADAARYFVHLYHSPSETNVIERAERFADFLEAKQPIGGKAASQTCPHSPKERPSTGAIEIRFHLFFYAHVANHRRVPSSINRTPLRILGQIRVFTSRLHHLGEKPPNSVGSVLGYRAGSYAP